MSIKSGVTKGTPARVLFGAGVYFQGVDYAENSPPTEEEILAALMGATQEGGTLTITPEFFRPEIDGVTVAVQELESKIGETAQMEVSFVELTPEYLAHTIIGIATDSADGQYSVVKPSDLGSGHYYKGFGYYGNLMDGRPVIILAKKALCTSGFTTDAKNKTNSLFKGTFEFRSDIDAGVTKLPYVIFIRKESGWTKADIADVNVVNPA